MQKTATIRTEAFASQHTLERIDLRYNRISSIEGGAFSGLTSPKEIYLAGNRLVQLNSDVFEVKSDTFPNEKQRFLQIFFFFNLQFLQGASTLEKLDLSENFFSAFPTIALQEVSNLKLLNLSSNMIQKLESAHLENLKLLQVLDLSRNGINSVPPATFRDLSQLKYLDLSLNSLRTVSLTHPHETPSHQFDFANINVFFLFFQTDRRRCSRRFRLIANSYPPGQ